MFRIIFNNIQVDEGLPLVAQMVKNPPAMQETRVRSLGWEDPLEKEMAIYSSILAWRIPWTRSLADYSPQGHKELDKTEQHTLSLCCAKLLSLIGTICLVLIFTALEDMIHI